jgi:hypothetical protein
MQWQQMTYLDGNLTLSDLQGISNDLLDRAKYIRRIGQKSKIKPLEMWLSQSPMLAQLSCSEEHLTKALSALRYLMATNESVNGLIPLKSVNPQSDGYLTCLLLTESMVCMMTTLGILEEVFLD